MINNDCLSRVEPEIIIEILDKNRLTDMRDPEYTIHEDREWTNIYIADLTLADGLLRSIVTTRINQEYDYIKSTPRYSLPKIPNIEVNLVDLHEDIDSNRMSNEDNYISGVHYGARDEIPYDSQHEELNFNFMAIEKLPRNQFYEEYML